MAINSYFLNAPNLASATGVYLDSTFTICAPDGFYQQDDIVRELVGCTLLPQQFCPNCPYPCSTNVSYSATRGVYRMTIDVGGGIGAIIIKISPYNIPVGGFFITKSSSAVIWSI